MDTLIAFTKSAAFYLGVLFFSLAICGFLGIFFFDASLSVIGCSLVLAASIALWAWICWRSEEPAPRTLATLLIYSAMLIALGVALALLQVVLIHDGPRLWAVVMLALASVLFWYLRGVVVRRNRAIGRRDRAT